MAKKLSKAQEYAKRRIWWRGMTPVQAKILNAMDEHYADYPDGFDLRTIARLADVSYWAVCDYLPTLESLEYVIIERYPSGRMKDNGVIFNFGLSLEGW